MKEFDDAINLKNASVIVGAKGISYRREMLAAKILPSAEGTAEFQANAADLISQAKKTEFVNISASQLIDSINASIEIPSSGGAIRWIGVIVSCGLAYCLISANYTQLVSFTLPLVVCLFPSLAWARKIDFRRSSEKKFDLKYDLDDRASTTFEKIGKSCASLSLSYEILANATKFRTVVATSNLPHISVNRPVWSIVFGDEAVFFLPDQIVVWAKGQYKGIGYNELSLDFNVETLFKAGPSDASETVYHYEHEKLDGTPDYRFKENSSSPETEYGRVVFFQDSSNFLELYVSNQARARQFQIDMSEIQKLYAQNFKAANPNLLDNSVTGTATDSSVSVQNNGEKDNTRSVVPLHFVPAKTSITGILSQLVDLIDLLETGQEQNQLLRNNLLDLFVRYILLDPPQAAELRLFPSLLYAMTGVSITDDEADESLTTRWQKIRGTIFELLDAVQEQLESKKVADETLLTKNFNQLFSKL